MRLRTKFTFMTISIVLVVVAVLSCVFAAQLLEQLISETDRRAADLAEQVFMHAKYALVEAAQQGLHPASYAPEDIHDYARHAFEISEGLRTELVAAHTNRLIYEVSITDTDGIVLASTDPNLPGKLLPRRASLSALVSRSLIHQTRVLLWPMWPNKPQLFEHDYSFANDRKPFGQVRVVVDAELLTQEIRVGLRNGAIIVLAILIVSVLLVVIASGILTSPGGPNEVVSNVRS